MEIDILRCFNLKKINFVCVECNINIIIYNIVDIKYDEREAHPCSCGCLYDIWIYLNQIDIYYKKDDILIATRSKYIWR